LATEYVSALTVSSSWLLIAAIMKNLPIIMDLGLRVYRDYRDRDDHGL
jgi:hypothetical protein